MTGNTQPMEIIKRNVLLNPGPGTTTDTVKFAQLVPDICPREKEFVDVMNEVSEGLVKVVHGDPNEYAAVLFTGSGTICIDVVISSLVPAGKKILIVNNGAYSARGAEVCRYYHIDHYDLRLSEMEPADPETVEKFLSEHEDIAAVYCCHHETGTGILNPVKRLGRIAHEHGCTMIADTTSSFAMRPINIKTDNLDFVMASAQKGIMAMTGLSFVIGKITEIEKSKDYPTRSYYTNLYLQYSFMRDKKEMHFTPPVQAVYAARQGLREYWEEGELPKWERHYAVWKEICSGAERLGLRLVIPEEMQSGLVALIRMPDDDNFDFDKVHDYCRKRGYTIYPGKTAGINAFRLCAYGAINTEDIRSFYIVLAECFIYYGIMVPCRYK